MRTNSKMSLKFRTLPLLIAAAVVAALAVAVQAAAQQANAPDPGSAQVKIRYTEIKRIPVKSGQQMYTAYCAACHGATGIGDGPAAPALTVKPTDLTLLSARNNGRYPEMHVKNALTIEKHSVNGTEDMPNWCPAFRSLDSQTPQLTTLRAHNLMSYLKTLQAQETLQAKAH